MKIIRFHVRLYTFMNLSRSTFLNLMLAIAVKKIHQRFEINTVNLRKKLQIQNNLKSRRGTLVCQSALVY